MGYRPGTMDDLDYQQRLIARTARQAVEAARATGTQSYGTTAKVRHQHDDIMHAQDLAEQASAKADRAMAVALRVDASGVWAADVHETPEIGPDPVRLVEGSVPNLGGYGRVRVSVAAFGSVPSRGPGALQVRLRVGGHVTAWLMASYAGDGVPYPGDVAPVRSFSLSDYVEWVDPGATVAVEAMCPASGSYPKSLSGMAHLSARIDYMEVV